MAYKIQITDSFENDLNIVTAYISQVLQNPDAAAHLVDEAEKTVGLIANYPGMFSLYPDEEIAEKGYRNAPVANYDLFYRIDEDNDTVYILRFLYAGQDITSILK
ncbi:MAG: type II toxin-antitoxin system RelE/ParE family toxin [Oscillospiraceae bacterium]|nr:type II toxin-antitoxin system RelE/ParE family toxin [Oscillospiraceae bacterium]